MAQTESKEYHVLGLMSGTSLDGLDMAYCVFRLENKQWKHEILKAQTLPYSTEWHHRLKDLANQSAAIFAETDAAYGRLMGELALAFIQEHKINPSFIAAHGHTIFHQPNKNFTSQIGCGAALSAITQLPVVNLFRNIDLAFGGNGAPLVPVGDLQLFPNEEACLNLGGIANISVYKASSIQAFDISPCNLVLNKLAETLGKSYDEDGLIASKGILSQDLVAQLNQFNYYSIKGPKSLGIEWIQEQFWPVVEAYPELHAADKLASLVEHIATQIAIVIEQHGLDKVLVSGGGALNQYLIQQIQSKTTATIQLPDNLTIHFKEALIFAFLGVLRIRNEINVFKEVTGATQSHIGGALWGNFNIN
jgi:anhydro-N-acetylmuramic acid kinase